ncbi:MAG: TonB-dependent receptor [Betaproteobacteria bacterium]
MILKSLSRAKPVACAFFMTVTMAQANHQQVVVTRHYDNAVGTSDAASQGVIEAGLLRSRPALRPGEILEFVPGVIVTQHTGDGKANQYFLRGFNLDHGTDFATSVNGMPTNLPTHAHGQGYSDLNFLIPELVQRVEYRKGPYYAKGGDFSLAGAADIAYRTGFDRPFLDVGIGQRGFRRHVAGGSTDLGSGRTVLGAFEVMGHDGPWVVPQGLKRHNGVVTLSGVGDSSSWQLSFMGYQAKWTATDQVPERLLNAPGFNRYGSLDPTAGGDTSRHSVSGQWSHNDAQGGVWRAQAYVVRYAMDLYSNFTYALERPAAGDQFAQKDARTVWGGQFSYAMSHGLFERIARSELGLQWRTDKARVGLYDAVARRITEVVREDDVQQTLVGVYAQNVLEWTPWLRTIAGVRVDHKRAQVDALSLTVNGGTAQDSKASPKLSLILGPWRKSEFFVNAGTGFHSNDARGATIRLDPRSGESAQRVPLLVAGRGAELGFRTEAIPGLQSSLALWGLKLDSELVYVGDAGATEASRASSRRGVEFNNRYTPVQWLLIDADFAWSRGRLDNGDRIPNAVDRVASMAVTLRDLAHWTTSLQWRYLGSGPLVEDNSVRSRPSSTLNTRITRGLPGWGRQTDITLDIFNLTNRRVNDIQYFYESRLPGEPAPVADRHVHPAEPRTFRLSLRWGF